MNKTESQRKTVLCVDPRGVLKSLVEQGLHVPGVRVVAAVDGAAALQAIDALNPDVIVTDLETPDYSGVDLALSLKGFGNKKIPVLLVCPESTGEAADLCETCEADGYVLGDPPAPAMGALVRGLLSEATLYHRVHYVEERLRREQRRADQAVQLDEATGFLPIEVFKRVLLTEAKRASRYHIPLGVVLVGFDAYAPLKSRYGEAALAPLFSDMAGIILRVIRDIDIPVRSASDAALLMLPHTDTAGAKRVGVRIAGLARKLRVEVAGERVKATVSVGVAGYDGVDQVAFSDLMRRARTALDEVRARGGDGVEQH
ncbi:MAG: diguanylate cyclase [Pseudomonadota bacterium]